MYRAFAIVVLTLPFAFAARAQEVQYIDLTAAPQRVALRFPPPEVSDNGKAGVGRGGGGGSVGDCAPDIRDPHAAAVYLDSVDASEIDPEQPVQVEFRFVNTGRLPLNIPVSPNRTDLQPSDPSVPFSYLSLALSVRLRDGSIGYVQLYGAGDHKRTTRVLRPGEWIRVKADLKFNPPPIGCTSVTLKPGFYIHSNRFRATPSSFWEDSGGVCINEIPISPPTTTVICKQPHVLGGR